MQFIDITTSNLAPYIFKVLKQVHPNIYIKEDVIDEIQYILYRILYFILKEYSNAENLKTAINNILSGELAKHSNAELIKAITRFHSKKRNSIRRIEPNLQFSVLQIENIIKNFTDDEFSFSNEFIIALTTVIEYLTAEILEMSGNLYNIHIGYDELKNILIKDEELKNLMEKIGYTYKIGNRSRLKKINIDKLGILNNEVEMNDAQVNKAEMDEDAISERNFLEIYGYNKESEDVSKKLEKESIYKDKITLYQNDVIHIIDYSENYVAIFLKSEKVPKFLDIEGEYTDDLTYNNKKTPGWILSKKSKQMQKYLRYNFNIDVCPNDQLWVLFHAKNKTFDQAKEELNENINSKYIFDGVADAYPDSNYFSFNKEEVFIPKKKLGKDPYLFMLIDEKMDIVYPILYYLDLKNKPKTIGNISKKQLNKMADISKEYEIFKECLKIYNEEKEDDCEEIDANNLTFDKFINVIDVTETSFPVITKITPELEKFLTKQDKKEVNDEEFTKLCFDDIPLWLRNSDMYNNLKELEPNETFPIQNKYVIYYNDVENLDDFNNIFNACTYWGIDYPRSFYNWAYNNKKLALKYLYSKWENDNGFENIDELIDKITNFVPEDQLFYIVNIRSMSTYNDHNFEELQIGKKANIFEPIAIFNDFVSAEEYLLKFGKDLTSEFYDAYDQPCAFNIYSKNMFTIKDGIECCVNIRSLEFMNEFSTYAFTPESYQMLLDEHFIYYLSCYYDIIIPFNIAYINNNNIIYGCDKNHNDRIVDECPIDEKQDVIEEFNNYNIMNNEEKRKLFLSSLNK